MLLRKALLTGLSLIVLLFFFGSTAAAQEPNLNDLKKLVDLLLEINDNVERSQRINDLNQCIALSRLAHDYTTEINCRIQLNQIQQEILVEQYQKNAEAYREYFQQQQEDYQRRRQTPPPDPIYTPPTYSYPPNANIPLPDLRLPPIINPDFAKLTPIDPYFGRPPNFDPDLGLPHFGLRPGFGGPPYFGPGPGHFSHPPSVNYRRWWHSRRFP